MKKILVVYFLVLGVTMSSCREYIALPEVIQNDISKAPIPKEVDNVVVAHRGAFKVKGSPQNSIGALQDAIDLGLYAVEADIQLTADNKVVVYHDPTFKGVAIFNTNYADLAALGTLANGEKLPLLEDFIKTALAGKSSKLWLDVKVNASEYGGRERARDACIAAMDIARALDAYHFVEFLITNEFVMHRAMLHGKGDFQLAYQVGDEPNTYTPRGYTWASQADERFYPDNGARIDDFLARGVKLSIYMADNVATARFFLQYDLYGITTNDPELVLKVTRGEL